MYLVIDFITKRKKKYLKIKNKVINKMNALITHYCQTSPQTVCIQISCTCYLKNISTVIGEMVTVIRESCTQNNVYLDDNTYFKKITITQF